MRKIGSIVLTCVLAISLSSCASNTQNRSRVAEGAGIGGAIGAVAGGIAGHGVTGALVGGAIGAGGGALVGAQVQNPNYKGTNTTTTTDAAVVPATGVVVTPLSVQQVVDLTKQGISADDIIARIRTSNSKFVLTADDISYLHNQGVSQRVIDEMTAAH